MPKKLPFSASLSEQLLNSIKHEGPHAETLLEGGLRGALAPPSLPEFKDVVKKAEIDNRPCPPPSIQIPTEASAN